MPPMIPRPAFAVLAACTVLLAALAVACSSGDGSADGDPTSSFTVTPASGAACAPARASAPGTTTLTLSNAGIDRTYLLHIPPGYTGEQRTPLVLAMAGYLQPAASLAAVSELEAAADEAGYVVVFAEGAGEPIVWNAYDIPERQDDVAYINALLDELGRTLCVDESRIYATGYSNGGGMALRYACESEDRIAAIAVVAATFIACQANMPMVAFHGMDDAIVPFEGGPTSVNAALAFPPVRRGASEWAAAAGCDALPVISRPSAEVELSTFRRCLGGDGEVLLYSIIGGGHTWPGSGNPLPEAIVGRTTTQIDASEVILDFFDAHPPREEAPEPEGEPESDATAGPDATADADATVEPD